MEELRLGESDYRFACIIWEHEPLGSGDLVRLCQQELGWKKSTTYTVLKKLCERGFFQNEDTMVTALVKQDQVQKYESEKLIEKTFGGSLPRFITTFMNEKKLTQEQADELKKLIDQYQED